MFPLPISVYICIVVALGAAFITHRVDEASYQEKVNDQITQAITHETRVVNNQAVISQQTQKDKDDLQTKYDSAIAELRGMRADPSSNGSEPAALAISNQGLRLLESDAEVLIGFARQCQTSEIERNDVIQKYNALIIK